MPVKRSDYPHDWKAITTAVKAAAGNCCEWCGVANGMVIQRLPRNQYLICTAVYEYDEQGNSARVTTDKLKWPRLKYHGLTKVILTTAHLDRNTKNNERSNLAALCQRCHLRYDIYQHIANRRYGRDHKRDHQLKLEI